MQPVAPPGRLSGMRTYVALAALAVTTAACGAPATRHAALTNVAIDTDITTPEIPDRAARAVRPVAVEPVHDHSTHVHAAPAKPVEPVPPAEPVPHKTPRYVDYGRWHTPEAAMRYLARAYTRHDDVALRHVTNPAARDQLVAMRDYAPDLVLESCVDSEWGSYICRFSHAIKNSTKRGHAELQANPALKPGWYATALIGCGDG